MKLNGSGDTNQVLALLLALLAVLAFLWLSSGAAGAPAVHPAADGVITTDWIDGQHIEICTTAPGRLYVLAQGGGWWIGDLDAGCRAYPPAGPLIDAIFAPAAGRVYGLLTADGVLHEAAPLPAYYPYVLYMPEVAR